MDLLLLTLLFLVSARVISVDDLNGMFTAWSVLFVIAMIVMGLVWLWSVSWLLVVGIGVLGAATAAYLYYRYLRY